MVLDLFCGAGGAAEGYRRAGFRIKHGVDISPQPDYPFPFVQADALRFLAAIWDGEEDGDYDLIHASPPCQAFSTITRDKGSHPDLIPEVRLYLENLGIPYVIENVIGAPIRKDIVLCGSMFGLDIQRHRAFETSFGPILTPPCRHIWDDPRAPYKVTGDGGGWSLRHRSYDNLEHAQRLMDMPWVRSRRGLTEAIPPAYTEWIGRSLLRTGGMAVEDDNDDGHKEMT